MIPILLLLAQAPVDGEITCGRDFVLAGYPLRPCAEPPAAVEAFTASGAGTYGACPVTNWANYSEAFDNAAWSKSVDGVSGTIPTVTADQAIAPDGTMTADLVNFGACLINNSASLLIRQMSPAPYFYGGTFAVYLKGAAGGSGTVGLCTTQTQPPQYCTLCAYNGTDWKRCEHPFVADTTNPSFRIGCRMMAFAGADGGTGMLPAQSLYLWGATVNQGRTALAYTSVYRTLAGTALPQPTTIGGQSFTFTRTSDVTCDRRGIGAGDTGIQPNDLVLYTSNQGRVEPDYSNILGYRLERASSNTLDLGGAVFGYTAIASGAWSYDAGGNFWPGYTPDTTISPDGSQNADTLTFASVSGTQRSTIQQGFTATAGAWTCSVYAQGAANNSGRFYISLTSDGGYFPLSGPCDYVGSSWTRCKATGTLAASNVYAQLGVDLRDSMQAAQSGQSVALYGAQCEPQPVATSLIFQSLTGADKARNTEPAPYIDLGSTMYMGSGAVTYGFTPNQGIDAGLAYSVFSFSTTALGGNMAMQAIVNSGKMRGFNTTTLYTADGTTSDQARVALSLTDAGLTFWWPGNSSFDPGSPTLTGRYLNLGGGASNNINGIVSQVCLDPNPERCR